MINEQLLRPQSILVVGASQSTSKPGGKVLQNLLDGGFSGKLYAINPKETDIQGVPCYPSAEAAPEADLAILAIPAQACVETVRTLASQKNVRAFIIFSAGFSEESAIGKAYEQQLIEICDEYGASLIGPNCIGMMNTHHHSVFTLPIPPFDSKGVDLISNSGAVIVYLLDGAQSFGLRFNSVWSVGNATVTKMEDILEYMDTHFDAANDSCVKLLYIESIKDPQKFLRHTRSLIQKGCRIAALKSGTSDSGARAASSHTGAMASSDVAVDALMCKAGITRCYSRQELLALGTYFSFRPLKGKNIAIITHAGGPAVILTDALSKSGFNVPEIAKEKAAPLLEKLFAGASAANPIDLLATATAEQLGICIDFCEKEYDEIDGIAVIFGTPGLAPIFDVYEVLSDKIKSCQKPIYPILPSAHQAADEIAAFVSKGHVYYHDESILAQAMIQADATPQPFAETPACVINQAELRHIIDTLPADGYISPEHIRAILACADIPFIDEFVSADTAALRAQAQVFSQGWQRPLVAKVVGPIHKSDAGGVILNIQSDEELVEAIDQLLKISDASAVLLQPMHRGIEIFIGAKYEPLFGHVILCGLGGIFVEVLHDVVAALTPISPAEAEKMIHSIKAYPILKGIRGNAGINEAQLIDILTRLSALLVLAPEIKEIDLNPLMGSSESIVAVDARMHIER